MLKKIIPALCALALTLLLSACGPSQKVLNVYTWSDYINPEVVAAFEKQYNCKVNFDYFDSNELMLAKLKSGSTGYDVIVPSSYIAQVMFEDKMIIPLDHAKLPNLSHIDKDYLSRLAIDKGTQYSVPYMLGIACLAYNKEQVPTIENSWAVFANPAYKGRITMLNDKREALGAALKFLGYSLNSANPAEIEKAKQQVQQWKQNIAKFDSEVYKNGINSGEFLVVHGYSGDLLQVMEENPKLAYLMPKEGMTVCCDDMVITSTSKNQDLAYAFINYMCDPENAAANMEITMYTAPVTGARELLPKELQNHPAMYPDPEAMKKSEMIKNLGDSDALYNKAWEEVLFSK